MTLTTKQVATLLKVHVSTVVRLVRTGALKSLERAKRQHLQFESAEVKDFMKRVRSGEVKIRGRHVRKQNGGQDASPFKRFERIEEDIKAIKSSMRMISEQVGRLLKVWE